MKTTQRRSIVAGNWKMHGTKASVTALLQSLKKSFKSHSNADMIVFPSFVFLEETQKLLADTPIKWGAQNVSTEKTGAYTGEISASMLQEFGCQYVLVGHSERRALYGETDEVVAQKFKIAQQTGLTSVLCVGETLQERESGQTQTVIERQLNAVFEVVGSIGIVGDFVIAYEPVWAIGTGVTATPEQAQEVHSFIRHLLAKQDQTVADRMSLLYGGSVKAANAAALFAMADIDGGLVGGASLDAQEFLDILCAIDS